MIGKIIWQVLALFLALMVLAACSANQTGPEAYTSNVNIHEREEVRLKELDPADLLSVHFIDVGEGDAILVVQGDSVMLVDGGPAEIGSTVFYYLRDHGIDKLEYLIATHPFGDHIGGLPDVLQRMSVKNVLLPMVYHDTPAYNALLAAVEESGADTSVPFAGHTFTLGDAHITILSPKPTDEWENRANYSIVMWVEFGETSFLLPGDAMRQVEANLLDGTTRLSSDVLKVARHGAASATTSGFLDEVNPSIAVISAGDYNSFLSQEVLRRLGNVGARVYRTDLNGNVVITSDGSNLDVAVERN